MHDSQLPFQEPPTPTAHIPGRDGDHELEKTADHLTSLDPDGSRIAAALRRTFDMLLDGQHTGRYRWEQLYKTEKTHFGTPVEINLQREFDFDGGEVLDYRVNGTEVDCKYSQKLGAWMIPPEAVDRLCLGLWASDSESRWSARAETATPSAPCPKRTASGCGGSSTTSPCRSTYCCTCPGGRGSGLRPGLGVRTRARAVPTRPGPAREKGRGGQRGPAGGLHEACARQRRRPQHPAHRGDRHPGPVHHPLRDRPGSGAGRTRAWRVRLHPPRPADSGTAEAPRAFIDGDWWRLARAEDPVTRAPLLPKV